MADNFDRIKQADKIRGQFTKDQTARKEGSLKGVIKDQKSLTQEIVKQLNTTEDTEKVVNKIFGLKEMTLELERKIKALGKDATQADIDKAKHMVKSVQASKDMADSIKGQLGGMGRLIKSAKTFMTVLLANPIIAIAAAILAVVKVLVDAYKAAREFQKELGGSLKQAGLIAGKLFLVKTSLDPLTYTAEDVKESFEAIRQNFGGIDAASTGFIRNLTKAKLFTGVTAEETAKILAIQESISGLSREALLNQMEANSKMIELRGLAPSTIFKDLAANSEFFATSMKAGSKNVMNTAIQAAKLGVNLSTVSKISESLLDFESSIEKQMEASMLLGRQINLDKARQLSFMDDHEGMMREILKQVGGEAEFEKLKGFQRRALADAVGVNVEELSRMARTRETAAGGMEVAATTEEKTLNTAQESLVVLKDMRENQKWGNQYGKKTADGITEAAGG